MEFPAEFKGKERIVYKPFGARDHVCLGLLHRQSACYHVQHLVIQYLINICALLSKEMTTDTSQR